MRMKSTLRNMAEKLETMSANSVMRGVALQRLTQTNMPAVMTRMRQKRNSKDGIFEVGESEVGGSAIVG